MTMKYNILINQKAVMDNGLGERLDLFDLALFDFIYHYLNSASEKKVTFNANGKEYVEINLLVINQNMPLLPMKSRSTFINRMKKLVDAKLIERYENNSIENRSGYRQGENFSMFVFEEEKIVEHPVHEIEHPVHEIEQGVQRLDTLFTKLNTYYTNCIDINCRDINYKEKEINKRKTKCQNNSSNEMSNGETVEIVEIGSDDDFVERMYSLYPYRCPMRNTNTGKCRKDKERIKKLLKLYTKEQIEQVFNEEIENKYNKSYMSNFSTFLNNFPEPIEQSEKTGEENKKHDDNEPYVNDKGNIVIGGVEYR